MADVHVAQLGGQASKVSCRVNSEAQSKRTVEAQKKGNYNDNVGVGGVREEVGETLMEGLVAKPEIEPESYGVPITQGHLGDGVEMSKPCHNIFPDGTVEVMVAPHIAGPCQPYMHQNKEVQGRGVRVKFCVEFCKEGRVLSREGNDPKPPKSFWDAEVIPSHFTLATVAGFLTCLKKDALSFVIALITPAGKSPALMAWESIKVRTELTRIKQPLMERQHPRQSQSRMLLLVMMGAKSPKRNL
jgi:hypothetical protein